MATATKTTLGPADHDRAMTYDEFMSADFEPGFRYELIDGRLFVGPEAKLSEDRLVQWLNTVLVRYQLKHPQVINYVTQRARVFIDGRPGTTCPQPDLAIFANVPVDYSDDIDWPDVAPFLVIEVMTGSIWKDLRRNVELYLQAPAIREYWVVDARGRLEELLLIQHRRHGNRWVVREYSFGSTFSTKLLPGFKLLIDPRRTA
jgi:Uma2 family endonuclease